MIWFPAERRQKKILYFRLDWTADWTTELLWLAPGRGRSPTRAWEPARRLSFVRQSLYLVELNPRFRKFFIGEWQEKENMVAQSLSVAGDMN